MYGVAQREEPDAPAKNLSAFAMIVEGSAGLSGVPTRLFRCRSK